MTAAALSPNRIWRSVVHRVKLLRDAGSLLRDPEFLRQCTQERDQLKLYFNSGFDLSRITFDYGTMVYDVERQFLKELVELASALPGPIIEIGTLFGETTTRMALWKAPSKKIITVDNYSFNPWGIGSAMQRMLADRMLMYLQETGHVEVRCCDKDDFYREYRGEKPALVFLDADHSYEATKADIEWAQRIGAAIISGHDYSDMFPGVCRAVAEAGGAARNTGGVWVLNGPHVSGLIHNKAA